jgi:dTMP kinase
MISQPTSMNSNTLRKLRGAFVVIEGCDRAGKSTQAKMLMEFLTQSGEQVEFRRYPGTK